jgi:L-rhamnose mutarotase
MQRIAFLIMLRPGADPAEYKRRHDEIWPEMLDALRAAGIHNYSIFRHGEQLFAYAEVEDVARMAAALARDPINARWQEYMRPMIEIEGDPQTGFARLLPEMFHMD